MTSFDCARQVRRKLGAQRVGHGGTLDPAARGLLMILIGGATRGQDAFLGLEKEYWFCGQFGLKSATGDLEGNVIDRRPCDHVTGDRLTAALQAFVGDIQQTPPSFSALKYNGKPYYYYARKGIDIPRASRPISILALSLLSLRLPYWEARVVCSRGTYVRTLVEDIAERLGTCAVLVELVRERVGPYKREQALTWQELHRISAENLLPLLLPGPKESVPPAYA